MMDVSDGIDADLRHIMEESHCGAHVEVEDLPISPALRQAAQRWGWSVDVLALSGGEDYCLLLTVDPQAYEKLNEAYQEHFHRPLFRIGTIEKGFEIKYTYRQQPFKPIQSGFNHFSL
jgi:thiamine-monophosphate kinase